VIAKVQRVKELYKQLDLPSLFESYEDAKIQALLKEVTVLERSVFETLLKTIYKSSK